MRYIINFILFSFILSAQINSNNVRLAGRGICSTSPSIGQALVWNGTLWCPATVSGVGGGGVNTVFGRSGPNIVAAANDYNFNQLAGTASLSQLPSLIPANRIATGAVNDTIFNRISGLTSDAQTQLNIRAVRSAGTPAVYADDNCTTPGTYDQTCLNNAITAASDGTIIILSERTYTVSSTVTLTDKVGVTIRGSSNSRLKAASGLTTPVLKLIGADRVRLEQFIVDGNRSVTTGTAPCAELERGKDFVVSSLKFLECRGAGLQVGDPTDCSTNAWGDCTKNILVQNSVFDNNGDVNFKNLSDGGTSFNTVHNIRLEGNTFLRGNVDTITANVFGQSVKHFWSRGANQFWVDGGVGDASPDFSQVFGAIDTVNATYVPQNVKVCVYATNYEVQQVYFLNTSGNDYTSTLHQCEKPTAASLNVKFPQRFSTNAVTCAGLTPMITGASLPVTGGGTPGCDSDSNRVLGYVTLAPGQTVYMQTAHTSDLAAHAPGANSFVMAIQSYVSGTGSLSWTMKLVCTYPIGGGETVTTLQTSSTTPSQSAWSFTYIADDRPTCNVGGVGYLSLTRTDSNSSRIVRVVSATTRYQVF